MTRLVPSFFALLALFAACATSPAAEPPAPSPAKDAVVKGLEGKSFTPKRRDIVPGEAVIGTEAPPRAEELAKDAQVEGLVITAVEPVVGRFYLVKFSRSTSAGVIEADDAFTREVVLAFSRVAGVRSSEPNGVRHPAQNP